MSAHLEHASGASSSTAAAAELDALAASFCPIYASGRIPPGLTPTPPIPVDASASANTASSASKNVVVVWVDGCFDMMHYGHANALRQAREMGDILVVGVHSDAEIELHKGPPVMREEERYAAVAACKWVDVVVPRAPYFTSLHVMDAFRATFCVHGDDITTLADGTDCYHAVKAANRYRECARTRGVSTTELVGRMLLMTRDHHHNHNHNHHHHHHQHEHQHQHQHHHNTISDGNSINTSTNSNNSNAYYEAALHAPTPSYRIAQFSDGKEPTAGMRVAYVAGDFDLFHIGHIEVLRAVRARADFVMVGVYDDRTVSAISGANAPLMALYERVLGVLSCRYVDGVVIGAPKSISPEMIDMYKITHIYYIDAFNRQHQQESDSESDSKVSLSCLYGAAAKERPGVHVEELLLPPPPPEKTSFTTTTILWRIIDQRKQYEERNRRKLNQNQSQG